MTFADFHAAVEGYLEANRASDANAAPSEEEARTAYLEELAAGNVRI